MTKGFIGNGPDPEKLKPTMLERERFRQLLAWEQQSANCVMVFGPSILCSKCSAVNNPNNTCCHQCGNFLA